MIQKISIILGIFIALSGAVIGIDTRYGKEVQVKANANDIQRMKLIRQKEVLERRLWALEDQFGFEISRYPQKYRDEYRRLQSELDNIKRLLERL